MSLTRSIVLTLVLSAVLAGLGALGGGEYVIHRMRPSTPMHELLHQRLHLTAEQQRQIEGLERQNNARQAALEAEMRAANVDLARAIQAQHAYTPEVQAAVDRFHRAMGELQKETILHVLAMRSVLTPEQAAQFDDTVARSLLEDSR
jgi:Spy/CpxP family protein refolding chaperone